MSRGKNLRPAAVAVGACTVCCAPLLIALSGGLGAGLGALFATGARGWFGVAVALVAAVAAVAAAAATKHVLVRRARPQCAAPAQPGRVER